MEIENEVTMPLEVEVDGKKWHLFSAEWTGADGRFGFYFYAISPEHAAIVLEEIKETAQLTGKIGGIVK